MHEEPWQHVLNTGHGIVVDMERGDAPEIVEIRARCTECAYTYGDTFDIRAEESEATDG